MMYYYQLWEIVMNQFEYKGLPESLPAEWIEAILLTNGTVGIGEYKGKLYAAAGSYMGDINGYIPSEYIAVIPAIGDMEGEAKASGAYDIKGKPNDTIVVGWNNTGYTPEFELLDTAQALCEGRTSEDINVIFSRLLRIPVVSDSKAKAVVESAIRSILKGDIEAVASSLKFDDLLEGQKQLEFLDLVDVKDVDKLQYLNQYMDNILKRFMRRHGFSMNITNKLAQQTNAEMHGADSFSMIYPLIQLKYRKQMIDNLNRIFGEKYGFEASVEFSELLKNEYDKVINYIPDELNEKEVMTDTDEQLSIEEKEGENNEEDSDNSKASDSDSQSE
ncbi:MAG: hypothetical protein J6T62_07475 [Fibrobacter sp.]|nr:hypothetical protein [Fibrobacter sp.]